MKREAIATGKTVEDAIKAACEKLGVERERVQIEILELPSKRLLGLLGASNAKIKAIFEETVEERAKSFLTGLLERMDLPGMLVESRDIGDGILLDMGGEAMGTIIGHRGETLDALQYLVSLATNRGEEKYKRIMLDIGNYRAKRKKTLTSLARRIALNAVRSRRNTTLEPMNPYERRIIHTAVQDIRGAASWSVGDEPNRRVVIGPENGSQRSERRS